MLAELPSHEGKVSHSSVLGGSLFSSFFLFTLKCHIFHRQYQNQNKTTARVMECQKVLTTASCSRKWIWEDKVLHYEWQGDFQN